MGKYASKEKTRKKRRKGIGWGIGCFLIILLGVIVRDLLNLPDAPHSGNEAYVIGVIVLFLLAEAGNVLSRLFRKRKKPSPRDEGFSESDG